MNDDEISQQRKNLANIFSLYSVGNNERNLESWRDESNPPPSLNRLTLFTILRKQTEIEEKILSVQNAQEKMLRHENLKRMQDFICESEKFFSEISKCLELLCTWRQDVEYVLTNPALKNAFPLPHHLHRKFVSLIEACAWFVKNKGWHSTDTNKERAILLSKLQQVLEEWKLIFMGVEKNFKENIFIRENYKKVLNTIHTL